jgi:hypothetical protein
MLLCGSKNAGPVLLKPLHPCQGQDIKIKTPLWQLETFGPIFVLSVVDTVDDEREGWLTSICTILQCDERKDERVQVHSFWFVVLLPLLSVIFDRDLPKIHSLRHQDRTNLTGYPQRLTSIALEGRLLPGLVTSNLIRKRQRDK